MKYEALQTFNQVWNTYTRRIRTIVLVQNKIAVCQYFGLFAPIKCLRKEFLEDPNYEEQDQSLDQMFQLKLVCYAPSHELTGVLLTDVDEIDSKLSF